MKEKSVAATEDIDALSAQKLSVEINGEGKISLLGIGSAKAGGKGAMTFKFKRK
ncbi:Pepco domain-containing protein [Fischerella sp. PCC 9605]|uniref:Pepco domain-containing protein n=1 Tax=Fischerella sp. PCC 9605 TaxID=1173024 RepID=UPI0004B871BB|nr:hypothetical protein [Fischerella sp. PCC 9605]